MLAIQVAKVAVVLLFGGFRHTRPTVCECLDPMVCLYICLAKQAASKAAGVSSHVHAVLVGRLAGIILQYVTPLPF